MSTSGGLVVPDGFAEWCRSLPASALRHLSMMELRSIWEPMEKLRAENDKLRSDYDMLAREIEERIQERDDALQQGDELRAENERLQARQEYLRWHMASTPPPSDGYYLVIREENPHQTTRRFDGSRWHSRAHITWWREVDYPEATRRVI